MNENEKREYKPVYETPVFQEQVNRVKFRYNLDTWQSVQLVYYSLQFDLQLEQINQLARISAMIQQNNQTEQP